MAHGLSTEGVSLGGVDLGNLASGGSSINISGANQTGQMYKEMELLQVHWQTTSNNTWRTVFTSFNDIRGWMEIMGGDAASMDRARYSFALTSPGYGVSDWDQETFHNGGWNTGNFEIQVIANGNNYELQHRFSSYYNQSNTSSHKLIWRNVSY